MNFDLQTLTATVKQTTWEMSAGVSLDSLTVEDYYHSSSERATTPTLLLAAGSGVGRETNEKFLSFSYQMVRRKVHVL